MYIIFSKFFMESWLCWRLIYFSATHLSPPFPNCPPPPYIGIRSRILNSQFQKNINPLLKSFKNWFLRCHKIKLKLFHIACEAFLGPDFSYPSSLISSCSLFMLHVSEILRGMSETEIAAVIIVTIYWAPITWDKILNTLFHIILKITP